MIGEWRNRDTTALAASGGPLAHLVEHFHGMEGVAGSNPAWSTLRRALLAQCKLFSKNYSLYSQQIRLLRSEAKYPEFVEGQFTLHLPPTGEDESLSVNISP